MGKNLLMESGSSKQKPEMRGGMCVSPEPSGLYLLYTLLNEEENLGPIFC